jgi:hypothetical protein
MNARKDAVPWLVTLGDIDSGGIIILGRRKKTSTFVPEKCIKKYTCIHMATFGV